MTNEFTEANRRNWDERAAIHVQDRNGFYQLAEARTGADVLGPIEAREIGDIAGQRVLHLQCHFGLDTLSLAHRGAIATGLDFSAVAIAEARALAAETGAAASFVEADVFDARAALEGEFNGVFTSWGALVWIADLQRWARTVASLLVPGGWLYVVDSHPTLLQLEWREDRIEFVHDWQNAADAPVAVDDEQTYTGDPAVMTNQRNYSWNHSFSEILGALGAAGLQLEFLHEHDAVPYAAFPPMTQDADRMFRMPAGLPKLPLAFSLRARKAA